LTVLRVRVSLPFDSARRSGIYDVSGVLAYLERGLQAFSDWVWGLPLLVLVLGAGAFFVVYSRLLPYRHFGHGLAVVTGRYDDPEDPGDINYFQALSSALGGTIGLGNIAGVAVAITLGGPGAVFWMWITALVGVATKFFTSTLSIMYRGRDSMGALQGGPMYVVREGLGRRWWPLAALFCVAALFGTLPIFQSNQLTQIIRDVIATPAGLTADGRWVFDAGFGLATAVLVALVVFGGITRIGAVAARVMPLMVGLYLLAALWVLAMHAPEVPGYLALIVTDAFSGEAVTGGAVGTVMMVGVRNGAFSNEAGIGTEAMASGATKTREPIRAGVVAMLGPVIDTLVVCTCTALVIIATGVFRTTEPDGVTLTAAAFSAAMPGFGGYLTAVLVMFFSLSTMFTFYYYGAKSLGFLIGAERQHWYKYFYVLLIAGGAMVSLDIVIHLIFSMYALMAVPTLVSALILAPEVMAEARAYFARERAGRPA